MNDPLITRFAEACGATGPLDLRVGLADGGALAEGSVHQPFTLVGRDESCDVTLSDPDVHLRHAWFQVVDGRVFALDLGSRMGLMWPSGECGPGWLDVGESVRIGPFRVHLRSPASNRLPAHASANSPLQSDPVLARSWPVVHLDFRNGKRAKDRWPVNRAITLIGRSEGCKIHLNADDIAGYHCGLVHTPAGLWVVDLSGRGVVVNGERMRVAPLPHGAELWVGRFLIGCRYLSASDTPGVSRPLTRPHARGTGTELAAATCHEHRSMAGTQVDEPLRHDAEDEVPLGGLPAKDPTSGLPSSHIMCDAFRPIGASGAISAPILLSGSIPTPPAVPLPPDTSTPASHRSTAPDFGPHSNGLGVFGELEPIAQDPLGTVLSQFSDLHAQMLDQIQQSLLAMLTLSGAIREDQVGPLRLELARIQELNVELGKYQAEIIRLALTRVMAGGQPSFLPSVSDETPLSSRTLDGTEAIQDWVQQQMVTLQKERQSRWQKLAGLVGAGDRPRG